MEPRARARQGRTLAAERVAYLRDEETVQARGRVTARDSTEGLTLTAERRRLRRRRQVARATLNPTLVQDPKDGKGAITLTGDTITVDSHGRVAHAEGEVHVVQDSLERDRAAAPSSTIARTAGSPLDTRAPRPTR